MSFLSSETLKELLPSIIKQPKADRVKCSAYELSLGPTAYITSTKPQTRTNLDKDEQLIIPPGQFALLITEEFVSIPNDLIAFISIKFSLKYDGLVNVSGFHVDPGFTGRLKFSVYNAGPRDIVVSRGKPLFLIWFSKLDQKTSEPYHGSHQDQDAISDQDVMRMHGPVASPESIRTELQDLGNKLDLRIFKIESSMSTLKAMTISLIVGIVILFITFLINILINQSPPTREVSMKPAKTQSTSQAISPTRADTTVQK